MKSSESKEFKLSLKKWPEARVASPSRKKLSTLIIRDENLTNNAVIKEETSERRLKLENYDLSSESFSSCAFSSRDYLGRNMAILEESYSANS